MDESHVTLHQHFGNTGCTTKVTVYLERRMRTKQVRICPAAVRHICLTVHTRTEQVGKQLKGYPVFRSSEGSRKVCKHDFRHGVVPID